MSDASSNQRGKASFEPDLGRMGFVVIIPVMLWVFYTTLSGLVDIMKNGPDDNFGLVGAVIGSAAILSLMALSSWLLGSELAAAVTGKRRAAKGGIAGLFVIIPAFLFFFSMSAFFSYTYYHANLFNLSARKLAGETQPMDLAVAVLPGMSAAVGQAYEDQVKKILARQDTLDWMKSVDALIRTARKDNEALAQRWQDEQTKRSDMERQASAEEAKKLKAAQDAKLQIEGIEPRLAERAIQLQALKDQIRPWDERHIRASGFRPRFGFAGPRGSPRREFERDPSWSAINRIKASCDILLPVIQEMKLASDGLESIQCAPQSSGLQGLLDRRAS